MRTRILHIVRAKPDNVEWEDLEVCDLWFSAWSEVRDTPVHSKPHITAIGGFSCESISGEELFELWKSNMIQNHTEHMEKIKKAIENIKKFKYLDKRPEGYS